MLSHLTVLEQSASRYHSYPAFKILAPASTSNSPSWISITYQQFKDDVELFARHWARVLKRDNIPQRSIIGLWIGGFAYADALHIYGLSRAGYIPQLFSLRLPNPDVILELLSKSNARALVYDANSESIVGRSSIPLYPATSLSDLVVDDEPLPPMPSVQPEDLAFLFHTSGSTSGSPKLVPCSYRWLDSVVRKSNQTCLPVNLDPNAREVTTWLGSMCHIGQTFMLIGTLQHGASIVQPTKMPFSSQELMDMIHLTGLNRLYQFAAFLSVHLRASRKDPKLLSMLAGLDQILTCGMPLSREDEQWAIRNNLRLVNLFGSTEAGGATLLSSYECGSNPSLLFPLKGVSYRFEPIQPSAADEDLHQSTGRLLEFVILADSADCPDVSLRHADGNFHTGDLFQEVSPGCYVFCGRDDDWIKSENSLRCDTRSIEENVRSTCGNLVSECIVVGTGRPCPAMFIEPAVEMDENKLKKEILRKIRPFHSRRYMHERIASVDMIIIVPRGSLPRTASKGNIRRKAVEDEYKARLDVIYGVSA
ncbi:hypothetical protein D9758_015716 [Tetrapyrgos nigripes]|uniref:AMP-dependent synthetase/ligase domain-containing protein n=1 Tax=Tetrapyrgos nigripes TaxID=182062 RepID=A0A8H5C9X5_9AGAR|nr:hypothetical protein D9758_015716 [Tetrapyrgos nigripes]